MFDFCVADCQGIQTVTESTVLRACDKVSVLRSFQRMKQPESTPAKVVPVRSGVDSGGLERPEFLKPVAELADPMQSETVRRWLLSDLHAPK
jgi:hypothetical protein